MYTPSVLVLWRSMANSALSTLVSSPRGSKLCHTAMPSCSEGLDIGSLTCPVSKVKGKGRGLGGLLSSSMVCSPDVAGMRATRKSELSPPPPMACLGCS